MDKKFRSTVTEESAAFGSSLPVLVSAAASRVFSRSSSSTRYPPEVSTSATTSRIELDPTSIAAIRVPAEAGSVVGCESAIVNTGFQVCLAQRRRGRIWVFSSTPAPLRELFLGPLDYTCFCHAVFSPLFVHLEPDPSEMENAGCRSRDLAEGGS